MTKEDLFLAIGEVEGSRLLRSELSVQDSSENTQKEETNVNRRINIRRVIRNLPAAVLILSLLTVTAYAVVGYVIFDSPQEMITSIFGDKTGYDHKDITYWSDPEKPGSQYTNPAFDRVEAEKSVVAEDVAPYVSPVGQSFTWRGYTLTVDALMYDSTTKCGLLTCMLENPDGIKPYNVEATGEVWNHPVDINQYGYAHIIQEKTTDTCLAMTYYFQFDPERGRDMEVTISQWTFVEPGAEYQEHIMELFEQIKQEYTLEEAVTAYIDEHGQEEYDRVKAESTQEQMMDYCYAVLWIRRLEELYMCPEKIIVKPDVQNTLNHITLADGAVLVSPISLLLDATNLEFLHTDIYGQKGTSGDNVRSVTICYSDGTEYEVMGEGLNNTVFVVNHPKDLEDKNAVDYPLLTIMFNRIIDVDKVTSVIINGVELAVD